MSRNTPVASNSLTVRLRLANKPGMLGRADLRTSATSAEASGPSIWWASRPTPPHPGHHGDGTRDEEHERALRRPAPAGARGHRDRSGQRPHLPDAFGGKIEVPGRAPLKNRNDLSKAYTPGVARVCMAIHDEPSASGLSRPRLTRLRSSPTAPRCWASATLAQAAMPVMEGKAHLQGFGELTRGLSASTPRTPMKS